MRQLPAFALTFLLTGCTGYATKASQENPPLAQPAPANYARPCAQLPTTPEQSFECDRKSILAMAGEFRVRFAFDETAALAPGYAPHAPQRSGGTELVIVIGDTGNSISLQHILVLGKDHTVVKHWRQDWRYEPDRVLRFRGNGRFDTEMIDQARAQHAWSQTVFEVDDAPRYGGIGRWTHDDGVDAWESDRTWRPLPRREYTKREDYQALEVVNRHTLTPGGWAHEQDNTKLVLDGKPAHALAREYGINSYTRIADYDFSAGRDYWLHTAAFWAEVRAEWQRQIAAQPEFVTRPEPNGEPRIDELFTLAERAESGETIPPADVRDVIARYFSADTR